METMITATSSPEAGTWDLSIADTAVGVLERINMGDNDQFIFTDTFGHQINLDVSDPHEAMQEITYLFENSTRH